MCVCLCTYLRLRPRFCCGSHHCRQVCLHPPSPPRALDPSCGCSKASEPMPTAPRRRQLKTLVFPPATRNLPKRRAAFLGKRNVIIVFFLLWRNYFTFFHAKENEGEQSKEQRFSRMCLLTIAEWRSHPNGRWEDSTGFLSQTSVESGFDTM